MHQRLDAGKSLMLEGGGSDPWVVLEKKASIARRKERGKIEP